MVEKIIVTGGSGRAGLPVVKALIKQGFEVRNIDLVPSPGLGAISAIDPQLTDWGWTDRPGFVRHLHVDLTDLGHTIEAFEGADAVIHFAALARPGLRTASTTFNTNVQTSYNVFQAASILKMKRVVWASSETALGLPLTPQKVHYAPMDEAHPLYPESAYALSKVVIEEIARHFSRWSGIPFLGLRISNVMVADDYKLFPEYWKNPATRTWNLFGYIDENDLAALCIRALDVPIEGAEVFIAAAADTVMNRPNKELMAEYFPGVPLKEGTGDFDTLLGIDKARRMLGYNPQHSWRDHLKG
jgi:nucleoside-diphosphate-sugar epimerase